MSFIDQEFRMHRWVPYVKPFPVKHSGANISITLNKMIERLDLADQDIALNSVNDNAPNYK